MCDFTYNNIYYSSSVVQDSQGGFSLVPSHFIKINGGLGHALYTMVGYNVVRHVQS